MLFSIFLVVELTKEEESEYGWFENKFPRL